MGEAGESSSTALPCEGLPPARSCGEGARRPWDPILLHATASPWAPILPKNPWCAKAVCVPTSRGGFPPPWSWQGHHTVPLLQHSAHRRATERGGAGGHGHPAGCHLGTATRREPERGHPGLQGTAACHPGAGPEPGLRDTACPGEMLGVTGGLMSSPGKGYVRCWIWGGVGCRGDAGCPRRCWMPREMLRLPLGKGFWGDAGCPIPVPSARGAAGGVVGPRMQLRCGQDAAGMPPGCSWDAAVMLPGCHWDAAGMQLRCCRDAAGMQLGCGRDATGMRPECGRDAAGLPSPMLWAPPWPHPWRFLLLSPVL